MGSFNNDVWNDAKNGISFFTAKSRKLIVSLSRECSINDFHIFIGGFIPLLIRI